jgi:hypothetical protein
MKPKKFDNLRAFGMHRLYQLKANPKATKEYEIAVNALCRVFGNLDKFDVSLWKNHRSILEKSGYGITE